MPRGYVLPEIVDPPDDICLGIHVPNDPAYIEAFWGAYQQLSYWYSWARDEDRRGRLAGIRWRQAVERSWETWERYGDLCTLEITVNCGCCSGTSIQYPPQQESGQPTQADLDEWYALPSGQVDDGSNPPAGDWATYGEYRTYKCKIATAMARDFMDAINGFASMGILLASVGGAGAASLITGGFVATLITGVLAPVIGMFGAVAIVVAALLAMIATSYNLMAKWKEFHDAINFQELVCVFYEATSAANAKSRLGDYVDSVLVGMVFEDPVHAQTFLARAVQILEAIAPVDVLEELFSFWTYGNQQADGDCVVCEQPDVMTITRGTFLGVDTEGRYVIAPDHMDIVHPNTGDPPTITCERAVDVSFSVPVTLTYLQSTPELTFNTFTSYTYRTYNSTGTTITATTSNAGAAGAMPDANCVRVMCWNRNYGKSHSNDWNYLVIDWI